MQASNFRQILIIQTAFIGDAILSSALVEKWHQTYPNCAIDIFVRKGNEGLFHQHPFIRKVYIWNKKEGKYVSLFKQLKLVRKQQYDLVVNAQRFLATGLFTVLSKAKYTVGFNKNPVSFLFTKSMKHEISKASQPIIHEIQRNQQLIAAFTSQQAAMPKLYPSKLDEERVEALVPNNLQYVCIAPSSVWYTKQWPQYKWIELINHLPPSLTVFILGAPTDKELAEQIRLHAQAKQVINLCGELSFLQSAVIMKRAIMNFVNDSAPMHLASSVNAPVTAIYCSTSPTFGFGPLSTVSHVVEVQEQLACRPCGLHGKKACPKQHFACANQISAAYVAGLATSSNN